MKTLQQIGTKLGTEIKQDRDRLSNLESTKVDKVTGKGLSTEDYTTAEKSKLAGIASGANNYTHPASGVGAGTYRSVTVNTNGHITAGTNPTTISGYGLTDAHTKTEVNTLLALKINNSEKGVANGVATLDANGKVVLTQIPDSVLGQLEYMGTWNFTTMPTATQKGQYWIANTSGNDYVVGDWAVWNGVAFDKVDNTDAVASVAGRTGNVVLTKTDVGLANVDNTADNVKNVLSATKWTTARTLSLTGDVAGSASVDGSANVTITTTVQPNSVNLGTDTTGNYMVDVTAGSGIIVSHTQGEGSTATITNSAPNVTTNITTTHTSTNVVVNSSDGTDGTINSATQTLAGVMSAADKTKLDGIEAGATGDQTASEILTLLKTVDGSGSGIDADLLDGQEGAYYLNASNINTGTINDSYLPDTITSDITGNAATATKLSTARTISLTGDVTGNVSFDGSADVTLAVSVADDSHNHAFGNLTGKPTTVAGYGITDVYTKAQTDSNISTAVAGLVNGSPAALDTLNELAAALGNDANFATTVSTSIGTKVTKNVDIVGGTGTKITYDAKGLVTGSTILSASDIPSLDASKITSGTIDAARLPSYVDDVLEYTNLASFPATGETGKIYLALDTNVTYRWSGSAYVYITSGAVDSVAGKTGVVILDKGDVGLGSVDNTADSAKNVLSATKLTTARTINGVSFDGTANITITDSTKIPSSEKGVANGVATLDASGLVPSSQLPSYVDDVLEYNNLASFPATGETGKIYVAKDTNKTYRWSGSVYIQIYSGAVDSVAGKTGAVTLTSSDVGLGNVTNESKATMFTNPTFTGTATGTFSGSLSGNATSSSLLSALSNYVWSSSATPTSFNLGIQTSFVSNNQGFQNYGSVITANSYSGGGGALQLYVPYSPTYGGTGLQARFGNYDVNNGNSWTSWKTILASDNYNSYSPTLTGGNASGTWGINITGNAATATTASSANQLNGRNFYWSGQGGQPNWLWGGNDGTNMYVYNPSNFSVNYANSAGNGGVTSVNGMTGAVTVSAGVSFGGIGSILALVCVNNTNYGMGSQVAGSSLRYNTSINQKSTLVKINGTDTFLGDIMGSYYRIGNATYNGGGTAGLSGTWVKITPSTSFASYYDGYNTWYYYGCCLWQRIA